MSIAIVLLPAAIAAIGAHQAARAKKQGNPLICEVQTRMRDQALLVAALEDTKAVVEHRDENALQVRWQGVAATFNRDQEGIWHAVFTGDVDEQRAVEIVQALDQAYGRHVQRVVVERLKARAPQAGMSVRSEKVEDDSTVTLILDVDEVTA